MPLTKLQYLRYVRLSSFGVVNSRKSNAILLEAARERSRCPLIVAPALEDVIIWDPRKGERVGEHVNCLQLTDMNASTIVYKPDTC